MKLALRELLEYWQKLMLEKNVMPIVVTLSPELESLLRDRAARQGQDVSLVVSQLLASILQSEEQDLEEAIKGIQQGLDDFEAGKFRSFEDFAQEQRQKHNLSID